ncbi:uncharacterized protein LOC143283997 isoform X2 [Babylonia areolata]
MAERTGVTSSNSPAVAGGTLRTRQEPGTRCPPQPSELRIPFRAAGADLTCQLSRIRTMARESTSSSSSSQNAQDGESSERPVSGPSLQSHAGSLNRPRVSTESASRPFSSIPPTASASGWRNGDQGRGSAPGQRLRDVGGLSVGASLTGQPVAQSQRSFHHSLSSQAEAASARNPQVTPVSSLFSVNNEDAVDEEEDVSCSVCTESRRYLKKLPCRHCFCEYCLQQIVNQHTENNPAGHFPCPLCRARISIPERGASDFPISTAGNTPALQLDEMADTLARVTSQSMVKGRCEGCGEEDSRYTCVQCQKEVCEYCRHDHHQHPLLLVPSQNSLVLHGHQAASRCSRHPSQDVRFFCLSCQQLLCDFCHRDSHAKHRVKSLSQAAASAKQSLAKTQRRVDQCIRRLDAAREHATKEIQPISQNMLKIERDIRSRAAEARAVVDLYEKNAISSLKNKGDAFRKHMRVQLNIVQDKIAGMSAIRDHIRRLLRSDQPADLIKMQASANDTIDKDDYLDKYTDDLLFHQFSLELKHETFSRFTKEVTQWIGTPTVVKSAGPVPVMNVELVVPLPCTDPHIMTVLSVCPVGDNCVWINYHYGGDGAAITLIGMCNLHTGHLSRTFPSEGPVSLVKIGQGLALASSHNCQTLLVLEGRHEMLPTKSSCDRIVFAKRELRACLRASKTGHTKLVINVNTPQDVFEPTQNVFRLSGLQDPRQMDISSDGQLAVIVDKDDAIHVVSCGGWKARMVVSVKDNSKLLSVISDVCFFSLGGHEVLLVADPSREDVIVLDVSKYRCFHLGFLTHMSGRLQHPFALNVDSTTGYLVVACGGKSIVLCGDTGVKLGDGTKARLKTRSA